MTRASLIEQLRRQVYGDFPADEATVTDGLVNIYISQGLAIAAKKNYTDNLQLEGVGFVNNSFYSTFKGIVITKDEQFLYKCQLPAIPIGVGSVDGVSRVVFKDAQNKVSYPGILLSEYQVGMQRSMRSIPNKILCYPEGGELYIITTVIMAGQYTASVTMVSGGNANDLSSTLNIPDDYINTVVEYVKAQISFQRNQIVDVSNDGLDAVRTT